MYGIRRLETTERRITMNVCRTWTESWLKHFTTHVFGGMVATGTELSNSGPRHLMTHVFNWYGICSDTGHWPCASSSED